MVHDGGIDPRTRTVYVVFDCLRSEGHDLLRRPLEERRKRLLELIARRAGPLMLSRRLPRNGEKALAITYEFRLELDRQMVISGFLSR